MKIIATEEHFYTEGYINYLRSRKEAPRREIIEQDGKKMERVWFSPGSFRLMDPAQPNKIADLGEGRLKEMDEAGIDMQVLSLSFPGVEAFDAADATAIAKTTNDEISEVVKKYPKRFAAFATIAPQDPQAAADELERAAKKLGLNRVLINSNIRGEYLDDKKYWVILERAEALDVPIYIHPRQPSADMLKPYLAYPGLANAILGFAAETSLHAMRLILSGVFEKYPKLKIILGHMGEAIPLWLWRIDSRLKEEKEQDATVATFYKGLKKTPSQYFRDNFYVTTSGMYWEPPLQFVLGVLGADKILFAADYPYESNKEAVQFIESAAISNNDKEKICHLNAEKLLKL